MPLFTRLTLLEQGLALLVNFKLTNSSRTERHYVSSPPTHIIFHSYDRLGADVGKSAAEREYKVDQIIILGDA